ncbi:hypothetical protein MRB53_002584 [Persea americana]|uniref:Uncharacterized protein n=2 Tax=Persea americana TaxID=3435 RepID=A0ACC2LSL9_PERAE|nr:hypothetical protein MRB53_010605 [Persea americana]KAJ8649561.1 hypothetical protein MRB53_002584 [Persea americana]
MGCFFGCFPIKDGDRSQAHLFSNNASSKSRVLHARMRKKWDLKAEVAVALEKAALSDEYFVKRKLYPNVDFYSGLIYNSMGFPTEFFPVLFAIPRMAGYLA